MSTDVFIWWLSRNLHCDTSAISWQQTFSNFIIFQVDFLVKEELCSYEKGCCKDLCQKVAFYREYKYLLNVILLIAIGNTCI